MWHLSSVEVGPTPLVEAAALLIFPFFPQKVDTMLIKSSYRDVPTQANGRPGTIRIFLIEPNLSDYPQAKFPGCTLIQTSQSIS